MISFTIPGKPIAKGRPRVMPGGGAFTPKNTKAYEKVVQGYALEARQKAGKAIFKGDCSLKVDFYGSHPLSDWDNLGKTISDSLNGIIWLDDRQVVHAEITKLYCEKGKERTEVTADGWD